MSFGPTKWMFIMVIFKEFLKILGYKAAQKV